MRECGSVNVSACEEKRIGMGLQGKKKIEMGMKGYSAQWMYGVWSGKEVRDC